MPRTWPPTEPLRFSLNSETIVFLDRLALTGLYGNDRGDVARTFITEGIRRAVLNGHGVDLGTGAKSSAER